MALVLSNNHTTLLTQYSRLFQKHQSASDPAASIWAASLGQKVNLVILFLITFVAMWLTLNLVSFGSWSRTMSKTFFFPNQIDLTVKRRKAGREQATGSGRSWQWVGRRRKGRGLQSHRCSAPTSSYPLPAHHSNTGLALHLPSAPLASPHCCLMTFILNSLWKALWGDTGSYMLLGQVQTEAAPKRPPQDEPVNHIAIHGFMHFTLLHFYKLSVCSNASWSKSISIIFPAAFAHFLSLCPILAILIIFQTLPWKKDDDSLKVQMMASIFQEKSIFKLRYVHYFFRHYCTLHRPQQSVSITSFFYFFKLLFYIGLQLINNVVIVSGGQQRDSAVHIHLCNFCMYWETKRFMQFTLLRHSFYQGGMCL